MQKNLSWPELCSGGIWWDRRILGICPFLCIIYTEYVLFWVNVRLSLWSRFIAPKWNRCKSWIASSFILPQSIMCEPPVPLICRFWNGFPSSCWYFSSVLKPSRNIFEMEKCIWRWVGGWAGGWRENPTTQRCTDQHFDFILFIDAVVTAFQEPDDYHFFGASADGITLQALCENLKANEVGMGVGKWNILQGEMLLSLQIGDKAISGIVLCRISALLVIVRLKSPGKSMGLVSGRDGAVCVWEEGKYHFKKKKKKKRNQIPNWFLRHTKLIWLILRWKTKEARETCSLQTTFS